MKKRPRESNYNSLSKEKIGSSIDLAVKYLQQGRIVAFPTETYYGLAVDPENGSAVERLYLIKKRPVNKPLLLLVEDVNKLNDLTCGFPKEFRPLIDRYWPGPLTLIFPAADLIHPIVTAGTGTVGVRISSHPVAARLVAGFGNAITATSANISGMDPAKTASEVEMMFGESIDYILDGGPTTAALCSTIVGILDSNLEVIRQGEVDINCE